MTYGATGARGSMWHGAARTARTIGLDERFASALARLRRRNDAPLIETAPLRAGASHGRGARRCDELSVELQLCAAAEPPTARRTG